MKPIRVTLKVIIYSFTAAGLFSWGYLAHRNQLFPDQFVKSAADELGFRPGATSRRFQAKRQIIEPAVPPPLLGVLKSLPYVQARFDPKSAQRGVITFDTMRAEPGANFYNGPNQALLIDMKGDTIHEWKYEYPGGYWIHAELLKDGSVLVVVKDVAIIKLDRCSNLVWSHETRAHHDVWVEEDGKIYVLTRDLADAPDVHPTRRILDDRITVLTATGLVEYEMSILKLLRESQHDHLLPNVGDMEFDESAELDPIHTNHVEVFDGSLARRSALFKRGNLLISMRSLNAIAIIDGSTRQIIWLWGPNNLVLQHHPRLLPNGHILIFDNGTERSRVIELDPIQRMIVWTYENGTDFFSATRGAVQRLPNGNTLITESDKGYVFEVNPGGEVLWKFANPEVDEEGKRSIIWRMTRLSPSTRLLYESVECVNE